MDTCSICIEEIASEEEMVRTCDGKHTHCKTCFQDWVASKVQQREDTYCPLCRSHLMNYHESLRSFTGPITTFIGDAKRLEKNYLNGVLHGVSRSWYPSGQLHTESFYQHGKKIGVDRLWYESGQLHQEIVYGENEFKQSRIWCESGSLVAEYFYQGDVMHGLSRVWYKSGQIKHEASYNMGKLREPCKSWKEDGTLLHGISYPT